MKRSKDPDNDTLITRGVLLVGSGVLFAHVLFPFIWWNFMGGSAYYSNPQMIYGIPTNYRVVTYTPVIRATATMTGTVTVMPEQTKSVKRATSESWNEASLFIGVLCLQYDTGKCYGVDELDRTTYLVSP